MGLAVSLPPITLELPANVQKINDKIAFLVFGCLVLADLQDSRRAVAVVSVFLVYLRPEYLRLMIEY